MPFNMNDLADLHDLIDGLLNTKARALASDLWVHFVQALTCWLIGRRTPPFSKKSEGELLFNSFAVFTL